MSRFDHIGKRHLRRLAWVALMCVVLAMQSMVAAHRTLHGAHVPDSSASAAHVHDHDAHAHEHAHDPWAQHQDAGDCALFDAALAANPISELPAYRTELEAGRDSARPAATGLISRHVYRVRARDPPVMA
jgi:hypothetical protein